MTIIAKTALAGRVVAVTGAARGIGAGIVEAVLDAGGSVALIDLALKASEETAQSA